MLGIEVYAPLHQERQLDSHSGSEFSGYAGLAVGGGPAMVAISTI